MIRGFDTLTRIATTSPQGSRIMSVENLYSYLEYLNLAIDQLEDAVNAQAQENTQLTQQLGQADHTLLEARAEIDRLNAQLQMTTEQADQYIKSIEAQLLALTQSQAQTTQALADAQAQLSAVIASGLPSAPQMTPASNIPASPAKQRAKNAGEAQVDLFGGWTATPAAPPIKAAAKAGIANDQNALILAKKLDSTIDKVQRLIGQAR